MTELAAALLGFYIAFNWRWLWAKFSGATNRERVAFGVLCYTFSLLVWWWRVM